MSLDPLLTFVHQAMSHEILTAEEERDLARRGRAGDERALELLVEHNIRLVYSIARRYARHAPVLDLVQEGCIGLMRAAEKFDPERGFKFSTYATWWIRQAIQRSLPEHTHLARLPTHISGFAVKLAQSAVALEQTLGREPTNAEIAEDAGVKPELAERLLALKNPAQIDAMLDFGEGQLARQLADPNETATLDRAELHSDLEEVFARVLTPREAEIVRLRYGIDDGQERTLDEVGRKFGITKERVRQVQRRALEKLAAEPDLESHAA